MSLVDCYKIEEREINIKILMLQRHEPTSTAIAPLTSRGQHHEQQHCLNPGIVSSCAGCCVASSSVYMGPAYPLYLSSLQLTTLFNRTYTRHANAGWAEIRLNCSRKMTKKPGSSTSIQFVYWFPPSLNTYASYQNNYFLSKHTRSSSSN
jgi:hypothetical protein